MDQDLISPHTPKSFRDETRNRREKLLELARKIGFWNMDSEVLGPQFKVNPRTIRKDIQWLKGHYKPQEIREIKIETDVALKKALRQSLLLVNNGDPNIQAKAISCVNNCVRELRDHLESWGEKPKIADKLKIETPYTLKIIHNYNDRNAMGTKSKTGNSMGNSERQENN